MGPPSGCRHGRGVRPALENAGDDNESRRSPDSPLADGTGTLAGRQIGDPLFGEADGESCEGNGQEGAQGTQVAEPPEAQSWGPGDIGWVREKRQRAE